MPVLLKHGGKHIVASSSHHSFPRPESNLSRHTAASAGSEGPLESQRRNLQLSVHSSEQIKISKKWKRLLKRLYRRYHLKYLIPLMITMVYMVIGAVIFLWLEGGAEEQRISQRRKRYNIELNLLVKRISEIAQDLTAQRAGNRRKFVREAVDHFHRQTDTHPLIEPEWSLTSAMYFSGTIFTTIGSVYVILSIAFSTLISRFGDIACKTVSGRIMTVVYAIVGIPIMLITLNDLGKFLYKTINDILGAYNRRLAWLQKLMHKSSNNKPDELSVLEQGNATKDVLVTTDEVAPRVSFNLRPVSEELPLNLETFEDTDANAEITTNESEQLQQTIRPTNRSKSPPLNHPLGVFSQQRSDTAENSLDALSKPDMIAEEEWIATTEPSPRMPVLVAVSVTVGWIFLCAALFKIWENWTYAESCYFMFISLSTIGLGDLSVRRRDLMVVCFIFVIIGLSLVSMCISVIQAALQDLYKRILMKLLTEYQTKLAQGDHKSASMGMMRMWGNSKTAKYLMPMLSAETRRTVITQIQEEAKENGIEIPPIFEDLDEKTGMPKILAVMQEATAQGRTSDLLVNDIVRQTDPTRCSLPNRARGSNIVYYDDSAQTDTPKFEDKGHQTINAVTDELAIQTDALNDVQLLDENVQTDSVALSENTTQTLTVEFKDKDTNTAVTVSSESTDFQTETIQTNEQALQTYTVNLIETESQTPVIETKNERIQTPYPELNSIEVQTDDMDLSEFVKSPSRITQARRRIQKAFRSKSKNQASSVDLVDKQEPEMSEWKDVSESEGDPLHSSNESLDWDPVDGMHAERQRPVKDLKRIFDKKETLRRK